MIKNRRMFAMVMIGICASNLIGGCDSKSKEVVDYEVDTQAEEGRVTGDSRAKSDVAQFKGADPMKFEYKTKDGISITVDSEIALPAYDTMSVIEAERIFYTPEKKEKITKAFFQGGEVYVYDAKNNVAKNIVTSDYSDEAFWGTRDGVEFVINFVHPEYDAWGDKVTTDFNGYAYVIYPVNQKAVMPEKIAAYEEAEAKAESIWDEKNECRYSFEQAQEIADNILKDLDMEQYEVWNNEYISWKAGKLGNHNLIQTDYEEQNGYVFFYQRPLDETNDLYATDAVGFTNNLLIATNKKERDFYLEDGSQLCVAVSDQGFLYMEVSMLFDIKSVTSKVNMLPLSTIEKVMEDEIKGFDKEFVKEIDSYQGEPTSLSFNGGLWLDYYKQQQKNSDLIYYLPVWRLSRKSAGFSIKVNAIDGTVLEYEGTE